MEPSGVNFNKLGNKIDNDLSSGCVIKVNVIKSYGNGNYVFNFKGNNFHGFSQEKLISGSQKIIILSTNPQIEIAPLNFDESVSLSDLNKILSLGIEKNLAINAEIIKYLGNNAYLTNIGKYKNIIVFSDGSLGAGPQKLKILSIEPKILVKSVKEENVRLNKGSLFDIKIISKDKELYIISIGGKSYRANINPPPKAWKFVGEIVNAKPFLEVKPILTSAKELLIPFVARELRTFNVKDVNLIIKIFEGAILKKFEPSEIERVIRNGGNFLENKLLKDISTQGDVKGDALIGGNEKGEGAVTKMQLANFLMKEDFFSFFQGNNLDFQDGVMHFKKCREGKLNLYLKLNFTNLGDIVISFLNSFDKSFRITVKTDKDISQALSAVHIDGCVVNWRKLKKSDMESFNIKKENYEGLKGLDLEV